MKNDSKRSRPTAAADGKRLTYAEALLVEEVRTAPPQTGRVLVAGNRSGVVVAEAMRAWPEAAVCAHAFDAHHARAIRDHLAGCGLPAEHVLCTPQVGEGYASALFMTTPRSMPAELVLDQLQDIYLSLPEGGSLLAAFEGDPDDALKTMRLVWPAVHVTRKAKHAILFRAVRRGAPKKIRSFASDWEASVPGGGKLTFTSLPGCFCHRRADDGGLALAEVAARDVEALAARGASRLNLLDMGCGCGLVGLLVADAARRAHLPQTSLTLIDSHARAIETARLNAARAGIPAELILADDGLPRGRVGEFDLFVGNPPYYSDYRIAEVFLETAYRALRPGGVCLSVVKTATGLLPLQETYFRTAEVIRRRGYCVLRSIRACLMAGFCALAGWGTSAEAADIQLNAQTDVVWGVDDPRDDLRPGLRIAARVRFDADPAEAGEQAILTRGDANALGSYILRVDGPKEGVKFSFFVNVDGRPEPRVSVPVKPRPGAWHDVAAGWDGTNAWLAVDGQTASRVRAPRSPKPVFPLAAARRMGRMRGTVRDLAVTAPPLPFPADASIRPGFRLACDATFPRAPAGDTTLVEKKGEYWLRYDAREGGAGSFNLFVFLDGSWEPRASVQVPVEPGRAYRLVGGWDGRESTLAVDGAVGVPTKRAGRCRPTSSPLVLGTKGRVAVTDFALRNERKAIASFGIFRTRELMPTVGAPVTLAGSLANVGCAVGPCVLTAKGRDGVTVTPGRIALPRLAEGDERTLEWTVDPGTNHFAYVDFAVFREAEDQSGVPALCWATKRIVFMPEVDPDFSAKAWNPPLNPTRTYHVDADAGDDARDGLSPATAWRTFRNAAGLVLGPGERLLLKRGCVFREELAVKAAGAAGNWAEIGAYGEGMRPQIRRTKHINDRCLYVADAAYLAIRDLIVCNAGAGLMVGCVSPGSGHVLVERCLAHHIEGTYRFNSHGIPEWWNEPGPADGARSCGIAVTGGRPRHVVVRDCESYQCSSGFSVRGTDTFVNRVFCHDNYAHNTSPHPYNTASRSWMTDCVFDASGWHAAAGTMGVMLAGNDGWVVRGCHFLNQPDSGSPDQGGIDFEAQGENCLVDRCTFRNNAGAAIEVLGLRSPQTRNVQIRGCRFDRNNWAYKNGPAEIQVWGSPATPDEVACSNGRIEGNGYVLVPGVPFYVNESRTTNDWILAGNRAFDFSEDLDAAFPYVDPPEVKACGEVWTDDPVAALSAKVDDPKAAVRWEQIEGPAGVRFAQPAAARTKAAFPGVGDYRVNVAADNGTLWRAARTAVHVLPPGARTFRAWAFARNLDPQGWSVEGAGTDYAFIPGRSSFWNSEAFPVQLVCGDYFVIAVKESGRAALVSPCDRDLGVEFSASRANTARIRMQNHTTSRQMRLWWQTDGAPTWSEARSVAFPVTPQDDADTVYTVPLPKAGGIKQLKLAFSADGTPITGTVRLDYIWLGRL